MIYVAICKECQEKYADVVEKSVQKGVSNLSKKLMNQVIAICIICMTMKTK